MALVLLIRPPAVFSRASTSAPVTPPLSIAYLAANLRRHGHDVNVIDALGEGVDHIAPSYSPVALYRGLSTQDIVKRIARKPDAIGVTTMFSQEWPHVADMIEAIHARLPDVPVVVGGEHATAAGEHVLRTCAGATHVALGEGERTIVDFAEWVDGKRRIDDVAGIQFLRGGELVTTAERQRVREPDELPWPAWDLFDLSPYFASGDGHGVERGASMPILATRGCPYQCTFCSSPAMWTTRYSLRKASLVVDEIEHYIKRYNAKNIDFYDLTAIVKKEWTLDFCREIARRGLSFTWQLPSGTRSEALDNEVLEQMSRAGCMNVTYAPESGSAATLDQIKKRVKIPRLVESILAAKRQGIFIKVNLIIGFPRETRREMLKTLGFALRCAWLGVDDVGLYPFSPYPGSELYDYLRGTGAIAQMDRPYFASLMSFMNLVPIRVFCENVGRREIAFYRLFGMSAFYLLSFLLHPGRLLRLWRNSRRGRSDTVFEERLFGAIRRFKIMRQFS